MLILTEVSSCEHVHSLPEEVGIAVNTKAAVLKNKPNNTVKSSPVPKPRGRREKHFLLPCGLGIRLVKEVKMN